ncbi:MAG: esterase/lipase family protein [Nitrospiraceae bacterium]
MDNENKLPIIYVRGYAGTQNEVEDTVDDPFYGFNKGATHIRVGPAGDPQFFAFESPLVRLMSDHGYCDVFEGDRISTRQLDETRKSIWIYRYYDRTSKTFKEEGGFRLTIEEAAKGLRDLIIQVKEQTEARHVILIAHSMGGLICRSLIQKIYREDAQGRSIPEQMPATAHIHKLFTYGTPHGGIHFDVGGGTLEWIRDQLGWNHADDFGRQRMYEYLTPGAKPNDKVPEKFIPNDLDGAFPVDRVFCVVGTNARDYDVAYGLSRRSVGPQSDGLVQIEHAYVKNSHRAYIHRSHSGRYGMVNSEEGYQCLQRFLFGDVKIHATLLDIDLPEKDNTFYQAEVRISIRTLPSLVHEQTVGHYCPISLHQIKHPTRYPLFTAFLMHKTKPSKMRDDEFDPTMRYALGLTVHSFTRHNGLFSFTDHIESMPRWSDWLIFDVTPHAGSNSALYSAKCSWLSKNAQPTDTVNFNLDTDDDDSLTARISVPAEAFPVLGHNCKIELRTYNWK